MVQGLSYQVACLWGESCQCPRLIEGHREVLTVVAEAFTGRANLCIYISTVLLYIS